MQGAEERRLRRMSNTPQGEANEGNAADEALMVDQGGPFCLTLSIIFLKVHLKCLNEIFPAILAKGQ